MKIRPSCYKIEKQLVPILSKAFIYEFRIKATWLAPSNIKRITCREPRNKYTLGRHNWYMQESVLSRIDHQPWTADSNFGSVPRCLSAQPRPCYDTKLPYNSFFITQSNNYSEPSKNFFVINNNKHLPVNFPGFTSTVTCQFFGSLKQI